MNATTENQTGKYITKKNFSTISIHGIPKEHKDTEAASNSLLVLRYSYARIVVQYMLVQLVTSVTHKEASGRDFCFHLNSTRYGQGLCDKLHVGRRGYQSGIIIDKNMEIFTLRSLVIFKFHLIKRKVCTVNL